MNNLIKNRLEKFRAIMKEKGIDYYIIPSSDSHGSEYVSDYFKGRQFMSGFTGSAGTLLIGLKESILWTDGRYFIQAEKELKDSNIKLFKMRIEGYPTLNEWIKENIKKGEVLAFDGKVFSVNDYKSFKEIEKSNLFKIKIDEDLLQYVWEDRPSLPNENIFIHDVKYAGKSREEKLQEVREKMTSLNVDYYIISSLDDIAWLYNLRGNDILYNPVFLSYSIIEENKAYIYIDEEKVSEKIKYELEKDNIYIKNYNKIIEDTKLLEGNILIDPKKINSLIYENINSNCKVIESLNITTNLKAIKNKIELENLNRCQIRDGVAMVKFRMWLENNVGKEKITEISASEKLKEFRSFGEFFKGESFNTIAGYKEHAAMMHYSATKLSNYELKKEGLFLVDSGGQYLDGTTDITRTFVLGKLTEEEKNDFTLVLKGHINLLTTKFLDGTTGSNIDIKAREPLWNKGIDYKCGTGHGVGFFLNVHEGPQSISQVPNNVVLKPGMIITNEPGIYKEGKHGIRTENTMLVVEDKESEFGKFYKFDIISYCPIDTKGINKELLSEEEINWINNYHEIVREKLSKYLNSDEIKFLNKITEKI